MTDLFGFINQWGYVIGIALALPLILSLLNPPTRKIFDSYVHFISGPLGASKTGLVTQFARDMMADPKMSEWKIFTTYVCDQTIPFDLRLGIWPNVPKALIIIDEYLLLESNDMIPLEVLSFGSTLARQLEQQIVIISQHSRLAKRHQKFQGTIGAFFTVKSFPVFRYGRIAFVVKSAEPFIRRAKGYKAAGQKFMFKWIPASTYNSYVSRKIYGYTANAKGDWLNEASEKLVGFDDYLARLRALAELDALGLTPEPAAAPAAGQRPPPAGSAVPGRAAAQQSPDWFRPGGPRGGRGPGGPRGGPRRG